MIDQQELPYQPLVFIKTGVIGGTVVTKGQQNSQYDYQHRDILRPHYINHHNPVYYILFHTPSIYNWLRTVPCRESDLLSKYIVPEANQLSINSNHNQSQIITSLQDYVAKWEVAKLTFASKIYVNRVRQMGSSACSHLAKTQQYAIQLTFDQSKKVFYCPKIKCKECKRFVEIEGEIRQISSFFITKHIELNLAIKYDAYVLLSKKHVYVKAANMIWYQIQMETKQSRLIGVQNINLKEVQLSVYQKRRENSVNLLLAQPIVSINKSVQSLPNVQQKQLKNKKLEPSKQQSHKTINKQVSQKDQKLEMHSKGGKTETGQPINKGKFKPQQTKQKISELRFQPNKVLLTQQQKRKSDYIKEVSQHFQKPKQKDEYQLDYDRGKLKKKKQKYQYIQPDYNQVYKMVKANQRDGILPQSRKIKKDKFNNTNSYGNKKASHNQDQYQ